MQASGDTPNRILVGFDGGDRGRDALRLGELLAVTTGAQLDVVQVRSDGSATEDPDAEASLAEEVAAVTSGSDGSELAVRARVIDHDSPARALHDLAATEGAEVIVLGASHREGIRKLVPGSVAGRLLSGVPCPVAVAPPGYTGTDRLRVIEVGFDGSPQAESALALAAGLGQLAGATLRVIAVGTGHSVLDDPGAIAIAGASLQERLHAAIAELPAELRPLPVYTHGDPVEELLDQAERGVDLVALGSRGYGPLRAVLLGSVSTAVLERAPVPVLITPR